jgi:two-component SAPR family response regulator/Tfp pilus assembly protein PilF
MEGCLELLDLAEPVFIEQDRFENQANLMVVRGMILRFQGDYEKAIEISRSTEALVEEHGLDRYYAYQAKRLEGLGLFHTGHQKGASLAFEAAQRGFRELIAQEPTDRLKHDLIQVLTDTGMMSLITGDMFHAQGSFEEALSISLTLRGNKGDLANCANNRAYLAFLMGDYRKAWQTYEQALAAAEQADWTRSLVQVLNGQAELLTLVGEFKMAATTLRRAAEVAQSVQGGQVSPATYREMAELEKLGGNFTQAMYDLREAAHASNADEHDPETQIRFGGVHVSMEQWQAAREELEPALRKLEEGKKPSQLFSLGSYILAEACFQLGEREEAVSHLQKALHEAARLGYDTFLVEAVHRSPGFLQEVEKHWKNRHLHTILQRAGEIPAGIAQLLPTEIVPEEEKPYALQVRALGEPDIRRNGEILPQTNWQSARTRALFFFLLDRGKAKREEIAVEFWPEFSNAKVNSNFHATLWRVRNALGNKNIIAFDGQSYSIQERAVIFYDVHEFEGLLAQSRRRGLTEVERKAIFTQAIDLYCGDFLPDMDLPWIDMRRAELREKYLSLLEQSAADEFENRHFEEARWLYEKAIEIDPYQDLLHLGVMKCLVQLRRPASAKVHFEKYRQNLLAELGSEPMPELREFLEGI